jgi:hypothetical protein
VVVLQSRRLQPLEKEVVILGRHRWLCGVC